MEHAKHIIRAVLLLIVIAVLFVVVREILIYRLGNYLETSREAYAASDLIHGAPGACTDCHDEQAETLAEGKHASVSCEVCHAPLSSHVKGDEKVADMPKDSSFRLCGWCHHKLDARPKGFPQVVFADHVAKHGEDLTSEDVCWDCHYEEDIHILSE